MEIGKLIDEIKRHFDFLNNYGFNFFSTEIFNEEYLEDIYMKMRYRKELLNTDLDFVLVFSPRPIYDIYNSKLRASLSLTRMLYMEKLVEKEYSNFIDKNNLDVDLSKWAGMIEYLFKTRLQKVLKDEEWLSLPYRDPRDDY